MKTKIVRSFAAAVLFGVAASFAIAGPGPQYWQTLRKQKQFEQVKAGEKIVFVCNQCQTVSDLAVDGAAQAMEMCKEGAKVSCPKCKKESKVVMKRQRNDPPTHTEVIYVNDKGEECAFVAKAPHTP